MDDDFRQSCFHPDRFTGIQISKNISNIIPIGDGPPDCVFPDI